MTMPSDAAKKARTCLMKYRSSSLSFSQWAVSCDRSTSSTVQKLACPSRPPRHRRQPVVRGPEVAGAAAWASPPPGHRMQGREGPLCSDPSQAARRKVGRGAQPPPCARGGCKACVCARPPEAGGRAPHLVLLVHLPHLMVLDREEDKALGVGREERVR